mgnify:FL=1
MTDYDALETRPLDFLVAAATDAVERVTQLERELHDLRVERDAEKLKRQQAEHERDCILEDLAGALAVLRAIAEDDDEEFVTSRQIIRDSARAALAAQEKP